MQIIVAMIISALALSLAIQSRLDRSEVKHLKQINKELRDVMQDLLYQENPADREDPAHIGVEGDA